MNIKQAKQHLAVTAKRGFPVLLAGFLYWVVAGLAGYLLPSNITPWVYIIGSGMVFPVGLLIAPLVKANLLSKTNPLAQLAGLVGGMQILFIPLVILVCKDQLQWTPVVIGILAGAHFLPYVWIYESRAYLFLCLATVAVASVYGFMHHVTALPFIPFAIAIVYFVALGILHFEAQKDRPEWATQTY